MTGSRMQDSCRSRVKPQRKIMAGRGGVWRGALRYLLPVACVVVLGLGLAGCGGTASSPREDSALSGSELEQAERLYAQLKREHSLQRDRKCLDLAGSLLDYYPSFERNDEVLTLAVEAAARLGDGERALGLTDELLARYPQSPVVDQSLLRGVELAVAAGDTVAAAGYLITYHDRDPVRGTRSDGRPRAAAHLDSLSLAQLDVEEGR